MFFSFFLAYKPGSSEYLSDVTFKLGENGEELKAHKFFLLTASPVFHEIFTSNPKDDGIPLDLKIADFSKATMTEVCRFAYCENVQFNQHNMIDILAAATKLKMNFLVEKTINYIGKEGMNENTIFKILEANQKEKNMIINMKCFAYIEKHHQKCFKSNEFLHMSSELLRMMLQASKLPQAVAKQAIALWSAHPDNGSEDLDELVALISLNDYPDENVNIDHSDTESVGSHMSSQAGSIAGGNRLRNRRGSNQQLSQNGYINRRNQQQVQHGYDNRRQQGSVRKQFTPTQQNFTSSCLNNLTFQGSHLRKKFQFSNLNLLTGPKAIIIQELQFIYDLSLTDEEFQIVISDMTAQRKDLFFSSVLTKDKIQGELRRYIFPRPCHVAAGRKIWISIEFKKAEYRLSYESFTVSVISTPAGLVLRSTSSGSNGQIIEFIGYNDA